MVGRGASHPLLERDAEIEQLDAALRAVRQGGGTIAIGGPPGCGKTALLELARRRGAEAGMAVFSARGSELERGFSFGAARQLFERRLREADGDADDPLRRGSAALGWAALGLGEEPPAAEPAAIHGLWWVLVELAERSPVLLAIDDAQWLDPATVRWLGYAAHRLAEVPVVLVLTARDAESPPGSELRRLLDDRRTARLTPAPLSESAIGRLLGLRLGGEPDAAFLAACRRATAGNAFVVGELIAALVEAGAGADASVEAVADLLPESVSRWLLARLERLGPEAKRLARALAVCGDGSRLSLLARVAGLSPEAAEGAAAALASADLVEDGRPWRFAHDLVRAAIAAAIPAAELAATERRCAEAMTAEGADPEAIAVHWEGAEPAADPLVVDSLRAAAERAIGRGDPAAATRYLRRALEERGSSPDLLRELGRAELYAREPACVGHLSEALEAEPDGRRRVEIGIELADALMFAGRWPDSLELIRRLREEVADEDEAAFRLDALLAAVLLSDRADERGSDLDRLLARASLPDPAARPLCLQVACLLALRGASAEEVVALVERGYADGAVFEVTSSDSATLVTAAMALIFVERFAAARALTEGILADARRRGLVLGHVAGATHRGLVALREGDLIAAEADLHHSFELAREYEISFTLPFIAAYLGETLLGRGRATEAAAVLAAIPAPGRGTLLPGYSAYHLARGTVRAATGDLPGATADLRDAGAAEDAMASVNPLASPWRSRLAVALGPGPEAVDLVEEEIRLATALGAPAAIGVAARAAAVVGDPDERAVRLRSAVTCLAESSSRLEHARAAIDLGSLLRREGATEEAREHLLLGLDLADRGGAALLAERARAEAVATGARPRRPRISGAEALTPAELRVARLAAQGMTNRQIAEALFVTLGTVKDHLGSTYRKLGVASRSELAGILAPPAG